MDSFHFDSCVCGHHVVCGPGKDCSANSILIQSSTAKIYKIIGNNMLLCLLFAEIGGGYCKQRLQENFP